MTTQPPDDPQPPHGSGGGEDDINGIGNGGFPYQLIHIPSLSKKIRGSTGWFFADLENGELFAITIDSAGRVSNKNIEECFGKKWKGEVVKLVPKEEKSDA